MEVEELQPSDADGLESEKILSDPVLRICFALSRIQDQFFYPPDLGSGSGMLLSGIQGLKKLIPDLDPQHWPDPNYLSSAFVF
jgi:hypothetical protein